MKALLQERAKSAASIESFGSEQISRSAVKDASDIVSRVSGATVGGLPWRGQTNVKSDLIDAAASGTIGHGMTSWVQTVVSGPGAISFFWKSSSETNQDRMRFTIDGVEAANISGEQRVQHGARKDEQRGDIERLVGGTLPQHGPQRVARWLGRNCQE